MNPAMTIESAQEAAVASVTVLRSAGDDTAAATAAARR